MEVNNIPKVAPQKTEESQKVKAPARSGVNAYAATTTPKDSVDVSSKGRLLLSLREKLDKLPDEKSAVDVKELKEKIDKGIHKLSSEEIVASILKGTLFEAI